MQENEQLRQQPLQAQEQGDGYGAIRKEYPPSLVVDEVAIARGVDDVEPQLDAILRDDYRTAGNTAQSAYSLTHTAARSPERHKEREGRYCESWRGSRSCS
jgi:hypothetical protein